MLRGSSPSVSNCGSTLLILESPSAAFFASWSTFSFPLDLLWPLTHVISNLKVGCMACCQMDSTCHIISSVRYCTDLGLRMSSNVMTAWLSRRMVALHTLGAHWRRCRASITPMASASKVVCSVRSPKQYHSIVGILPILYITATVPTFLPIPDPSDYTCASELQSFSSAMESSMDTAM